MHLDVTPLEIKFLGGPSNLTNIMLFSSTFSFLNFCTEVSTSSLSGLGCRICFAACDFLGSGLRVFLTIGNLNFFAGCLGQGQPTRFVGLRLVVVVTSRYYRGRKIPIAMPYGSYIVMRKKPKTLFELLRPLCSPPASDFTMHAFMHPQQRSASCMNFSMHDCF